ncbi:MAG: 2-phosphosulfolactate phosphatase, partial [Thermaerobacterales bacterium]
RGDHRSVVIAGERNNVRIPGFHLGNSPLEFIAERIRGQEVVLCTTNGTQAFNAAVEQGAQEIYSGAMTNAPRLAEALMNETKRDITLLCAGTQGRLSLEDLLCAGLMVRELYLQIPQMQMNDAARTALLAYTSAAQNWPAAMMAGDHARTLDQHGFLPDVRYCAQVGISRHLPVLRGDCLLLAE